MTATVRTQGQTSHITQNRLDGVSIIRPAGALDRTLADDIRECSCEAHTPVVIDLTDCVLTDAASLRRVAVEWQLYRRHMCVVSPRATARRLLRRSGIDQHVPVFRSVDEAMQARGWRPEDR